MVKKDKPTVDLFLKTYAGDVKWLPYLFASIDKHCKNFRKLVVAFDEGDNVHFGDLKFPTSLQVDVIFLPKHRICSGYIGQQIAKLQAHHYSDADVISYIDSDCVYVREFDAHKHILTKNFAKIMMLKTSYDEIGHAVPWQKITEKWLGRRVEFEYMRRHPMSYWRYTLEKIQEDYSDLIVSLSVLRTNEFSEFNFIGAYAEAFQPDAYSFVNTANTPLPADFVKQYHSYTDFEKKEKQEELKRLTGI